MIIASFLTLALLGGDAPTPSAPPGVPDGGVKFLVRVLDMKGVEWRGAAYHALTPAARQGACSVWTARREVLERLTKASDKVVMAPAVVANPGQPLNVFQESSRGVVANLRRVADGPPGQNTCVAFVPEVDAIRESFTTAISCRLVDQGVMAKVAISDTHIAAVHNYTIKDSVNNPKDKAPTVVNAQAQVPEVVSGKVDGEWLIPTDGVLIVSLGAHTITDSQGKAAVRERLAVIEPTVGKTDSQAMAASFSAISAASASALPHVVAARPTLAPRPIAPPVPIAPSMLRPIAAPAPPLAVAPAAKSDPKWRLSLGLSVGAVSKPKETKDAVLVACVPLPVRPFPYVNVNVGLERLKKSVADATMPQAQPPTRDLPTPIAADGSVVKLPPLPDDEVDPASTDDSSETRPAPQARPHGGSVIPAEPRAEMDVTIRGIKASDGEFLEAYMKQLFRAPFAPDCVFDSEDDAACAAEFELSKPVAARRSGKAVAQPKSDTAMLRSFFLAGLRPTGAEARCSRCREEGVVDTDCRLCGYMQAVAQANDDGADEDQGPSLLMQVQTAKGTCQYDGSIDLRTIAKEPMTVRIPMADGSVVEVQARVVRKAGEK